MNKHKGNLRNQLRSDSDDEQSEESKSETQKPRLFISSRMFKVLVFAVLILAFFKTNQKSDWFVMPPVFSSITSSQPSETLLTGMNEMLVDMGYLNLSREDLIKLRSDGVTATYISNIRMLGFEDLTLDDATKLAKANVSSAFIAMMQELGYDLDIDDFVELRRAGVTAHLTSNIHDLGYTEVTKEQLIRIRRIGVTPALIKRLQSDRGEDISLEEIIRYRISNQ